MGSAFLEFHPGFFHPGFLNSILDSSSSDPEFHLGFLNSSPDPKFHPGFPDFQPGFWNSSLDSQNSSLHSSNPDRKFQPRSQIPSWIPGIPARILPDPGPLPVLGIPSDPSERIRRFPGENRDLRIDIPGFSRGWEKKFRGSSPKKIPGSKFPGISSSHDRSLGRGWEFSGKMGKASQLWLGWEYPKDSWEFLQGDVKGKKSWNFTGRGCGESWEKGIFGKGGDPRKSGVLGMRNSRVSQGVDPKNPKKSGILGGKKKGRELSWNFTRNRSEESQEKGNFGKGINPRKSGFLEMSSPGRSQEQIPGIPGQGGILGIRNSGIPQKNQEIWELGPLRTNNSPSP